MILRVYALYGRSAPVLVGLSCLLVAQIIMSSIGISKGFGERHPVPRLEVKLKS